MASFTHGLLLQMPLLSVVLLLVTGGVAVVESARAEAAAHDVPVSILGPCSRTRDKKACIEFLSAFPEARKATTVPPLAELYLQAVVNQTAEAKVLASTQLAAAKGKGIPPVCLEQCAASINALSKALATFFSGAGKDVDDIDKKYRDMDHFLMGFLRAPIARKQPPICQSVCPIRSCSMEEVAVADKFKEAWKLLGNADGLVAQIVPAVKDKGTKS